MTKNNNMDDWLRNTKVGHFIFLMLFSITFIGIIHIFIPSINFISAIIGSTLVAIILSINDDNKKWI